MVNLTFFLLIIVELVTTSFSFVPHDQVKKIIEATNLLYEKTPFGYVSQTLTHEEIIKRGIIRSVAKFFHEQPHGKDKIDLKAIETEYYSSIKRLYSDYYGKFFCKIPLEWLIKNIFQKMVVNVDTNEDTKDLPYAHFDADTFLLSNDRVIEYKKVIGEELSRKNYRKAAEITGVILHSIHDFYSHSNWVMQLSY